MLDCIVLGDSIAVGVGQARSDCAIAAVTGITSERYVQLFPGMRHVGTAIISLGVNDGEGTATADNLARLRARVRADTVYWLLTGGNPRARDAVRAVAGRFGDRLIDAAPLTGPDHVHPDRTGYARLAAQTRGGRRHHGDALAAVPGFQVALLGLPGVPEHEGVERAGQPERRAGRTQPPVHQPPLTEPPAFWRQRGPPLPGPCFRSPPPISARRSGRRRLRRWMRRSRRPA
ncbi:MAG: hypothetical protein WDN25_07855 [Acetobacteraceae bacterium]